MTQIRRPSPVSSPKTPRKGRSGFLSQLLLLVAALLPATNAFAGGVFSYGQIALNGARGLTGISQIACGDHHTVAVKTDGTVVSWGNDYLAQARVPSGLTGVVQVSAGAVHSVALKSDGTVVCWGEGPGFPGVNQGQTAVPPGLTGVVAVAAGGYHTVALKSDGTVVCWGSNSHQGGQSNPPAGLTGVVRIAAGVATSGAQKADGTTVLWGWTGIQYLNYPNAIQLATGEAGGGVWYVVNSDGTIETTGPAPPADLSGVTQLAVRESNCVALKSDGTVVAWGSSQWTGINSVPAGLSGVVQVAVGMGHAAALKSDGTVVCWGGFRDGFGGIKPVPTGFSDVTQFDIGGYHIVGRNADGTVACWGFDNASILAVPPGLTGVTQVAAGVDHSVALKSDGTVVSWGVNTYGQSSTPASLSGVTQVVAGEAVSLALKSDGTVVAWPPADNFGGAHVPPGLSGVSFIAGAKFADFKGAVKTDGSVVLWGRNDASDQYGRRNIPADLGPVSKIALGPAHVVALKTDGTVRCWGRTDMGQCDIPQGLTGVVDVSAGFSHTAALKSDGTVVAWGRFQPNGNYWYPVTVPPNMTGIQQIASGSNTVGMLFPSPEVSIDSITPPDCPQEDGALDASASHADSVHWNGPQGFRSSSVDLEGIGAGFYRLVGANRGGSATVEVNLECLNVDSDGDGVFDADDRCPSDPNKSIPGTCGCGTPDSDSDGDGIVDCLVIESVAQSGALPSTGVLSGDDFGASVAMAGSFAVVGAPLDDIPGKSDAGSARVFEWTGSSWVQVAELLAPSTDSKSKDYFGRSVAIQGDVIVVGAPNSDLGAVTDAGAAYVYRRSGASWSFEAKLTRSTPAASDLFGAGVAIRGDFIAAGAPQANSGGLNDSGEVQVFMRVAGTWTGTASRSGVPVTAGDRFGQSVSLGGTVTAPTLAVGATGDDEPSRSNCGAVYVMPLDATGTPFLTTRLVGNPAFTNATLGTSVAIDGDGLRVAAGGPTGAPAGTGTNAGTVTAWTLSGSMWTGVNLSPTGHAAGDRLGQSVSFDPTGATLVIGNSGRTAGGILSRGGAVVYSRLLNGTWRLHDRLVVSAPGTSSSLFGFAVAAGPNGILVGGPKNAPGGAVAAFAAASNCAVTDSDGDGTGDLCDDCPSDPNKVAPGICGCGSADTDGDSDGMADCYDACPSDPTKTVPGICGCGVSETDTDGDGLKDCLDGDDDNDGTSDATDGCPLHAAKTSPGQCGCAVVDTDSDGDGTANCNDLCPSDPAKVAPGTCGCGTADVDSDGDELLDCLGLGNLVETGTLPTAGVLFGDAFGHAVAADGAFAVIGIPYDDVGTKSDVGTARIAEWTGSAWVERAQLSVPTGDVKAKNYFGLRVSISGDVAVIAAPYADLGATADVGAVYVFRNVAGVWTFETKLMRPGAAANDQFGSGVSVLVDFIAVGTPLANGSSSLIDSGEVSVFQRVAGAWTLRATVLAGIVTAGDKFGTAISLGGSSASPTLAVGCPGDDEPGKSGCGAVYIHALTASGTVSTVARVISPSVSSDAGMGKSVSVDGTGTRVAAGSSTAYVGGLLGCGEVSVWTFNGSLWSGVGLTVPDPASLLNYGASVSLRADGMALAVGRPGDTVAGVARRGSVDVLVLNGATWMLYDRLTLPNVGTVQSRFGSSVAFRGSSIVVGAPQHNDPDGGTARSFEGPP